MPLLSDVIEETRRILLSGGREERNKLNGAVTNVATSLTMTYPLGSIKRGSKLSINLEDMYVWDFSSLTVSPVNRGQFGSAAAAHSNGDIVYVNAKFSPWEIFNAINDEIVSLSSPTSGLFKVVTTELTYNAAVSGYNFSATNVLDILEVRYSVPGPSLEYPISHDWEFSRNMSDEFASGGVIFVRNAFPSRTVLVKVKAPFTQFPVTLTTDLTATGLPETAYDLLSLGAAWRLSAPRELSRNDYTTQGDTRRADEVPPGAVLGGSRELGRLRQLRIQEEVARLSQFYPRRLPRYPYYIS